VPRNASVCAADDGGEVRAMLRWDWCFVAFSFECVYNQLLYVRSRYKAAHVDLSLESYRQCDLVIALSLWFAGACIPVLIWQRDSVLTHCTTGSRCYGWADMAIADVFLSNKELGASARCVCVCVCICACVYMCMQACMIACTRVYTRT